MGRKSTGEYPSNWKEIAERVKEEAGWKCVRCKHPHDIATGYMLTVHHLDLNKSNCEWWNIPALCQRCHLYIQGKVIMERPWLWEHSEWFKQYVAGYYASVAGLPTDKEWVLAHVEELIGLGQATNLADSSHLQRHPLFVDVAKDLDKYWPKMPDLADGVDMFAQYPIAGGP